MEKIIHQIWVGPYPIPDIEQGYIEEIRNKNSSYTHLFWTDKNRPDLPENLKNIYDMLGEREDYAFQADLLRVFVIHKYGGLYLDVDYQYTDSFDNSPFFDYDGVFFYHPTKDSAWGGDFTIPNGIFGAKRNSNILEYLLNTITMEKHWMGPSWMGENVRRYFHMNPGDPHEQVEHHLNQVNYLYYPYNQLGKFVIHNALASWIPEHKREFKQGNFNFQKGKK